jgi:hypothetical protein
MWKTCRSQTVFEMTVIADTRENMLRKQLGDMRSQLVKCSCGKLYRSAGGLSRHILSLGEPHEMAKVLWTPRQKQILAELRKQK